MLTLMTFFPETARPREMMSLLCLADVYGERLAAELVEVCENNFSRCLQENRKFLI